MESLQGQFLLSTKQMPDPRFREKLILMCGHTAEGAIGLVVNHPVPEVTVADILTSVSIEVPDFPLPPVYIGGPVEPETAFILYSSDYRARSELAVSETISLSSDMDLLRDIARGRGPRSYLVVLGYSGWSAGQLEGELAMDGWLTLPGDDDIVFRTDDGEKWQRAAQRFGIDITTFGDTVGSA